MIAAGDAHSIGASARPGSGLKSALSVLVTVALLIGTFSLVTAGAPPPGIAAKTERRPVAPIAKTVTPDSDYAAAYRLNRQIVVVPPSQPRRTAVVRNVGPDRGVNAYAMAPSDDATLMPKPRNDRKPQQSRPRWPLRSQTPDLATPPLADGPTPVRPTPRYGLGASRTESTGAVRATGREPRRAAMRND